MDPFGKFLYVMTYYYNQVFVYLIDQNTGALTLEPNSPFVTQYYYPTVFTLDATGQFAYIAYQAGRSNGPAISAYRIDPTSGSFTLVPGSPSIIPKHFLAFRPRARGYVSGVSVSVGREMILPSDLLV